MILAGDVGGTKVDLALYGFDHGRLTHVREEKFPAQEFAGLEEIVRKFLIESGDPEVTAACFGVPGPVRGGRLKLTNLPWVLDSRELSLALKIEHLFLINDLEANGYGIPELSPEQIYELSGGAPGSVGNRGLVSAGTGWARPPWYGTGRCTSRWRRKAATAILLLAMKPRSNYCAISSAL